jgi:hypothetical protein
MRRSRPFTWSLAVSLCGPLLGYVPATRAGFVATLSVRQPSCPGTAPLLGLLGQTSGEGISGSGGDLATGETIHDSRDCFPNPLPTPCRGQLPQANCTPAALAPGAGSPRGPSGSDPGAGASPPASLPGSPSGPPDDPAEVLLLAEVSSQPPPFPARLFRPPRRE